MTHKQEAEVMGILTTLYDSGVTDGEYNQYQTRFAEEALEEIKQVLSTKE